VAQVGILGDIIFEVSDEVVKTLNNVKWSGSARYTEHDRHMQNSLTEFTGVDADKISFDIKLSAYLGVNPMNELGRIWTYERSGKVIPFILGDKIYGKYRWTIQKHNSKLSTYAKDGNVTSIEVSVDLLEYVNR